VHLKFLEYLLPFSSEYSFSSLKTSGLKLKKHNLPVVLYGCETVSHTLREEHREKMFQNRVLRGRQWRKNGEDCITRSFLNYTLHQILVG
jgi:hypothetical protein